MKKIFLICFIYLFFCGRIFAFEFTKSTDNPLPISFINNYENILQTNVFKEGDLYKGIFVINRPPETYYSLGYFESDDGKSWTMKREILNTGADLSNPSIIKTATGYFLFITRYDNNSVYRIYSTICDVDFNCESSFAPVITPNLNNNSEKNGVFAGHPFQQNGRTYLFFGAWGGDGFKIKLAYSDDLVNWIRCPNDKSFLYGGDGPFPFADNNDLYLFFHRSDSSGIKIAKSLLPLSCDSTFEDQGYLLIRDHNYDQKHLIFPSIVNDNGGLKLYYSGLGSDSRWRLNLTCSGGSCLAPTVTPLPTSTPSPTPTTVPTATPTPEKTPIIIIPGFLASWNKDAIIHNILKPQSDWHLNPIVNEFKGIIGTLKNLGYEENKNLFLFAYDWRKPILEIVEDLNNYVNNLQISNLRFSIIGHSLGGLVGRIYLQKYNNSNIEKLITVGSPHRGATVAYKIVEAGEIERFNDYLWFAAKIVAALNKNNLETDRQTINRLFPVMTDLFPIYNFLKKDSNEIDVGNMKFRNNLLSNESYKTNESNLTNLISIVGEKGSTLKGFNIENQTLIDKLLDNYPDGRPISSYSEIGDYTVLSTSGSINSPVIFNLEHNELIYKKESIKKILDLLNIQYQDSEIKEGKGTIIDSSIIFLIKSPATIEVIFNGQTYQEDDGMIFIENAQSGDYQLKVKGLDTGNYQVLIGQIGKNTDAWDSIYGETTADKTEDYYIHYNRESPDDIPSDDLFNYLKIKGYQLNDLKDLHKLFELLIKNRDFIGLEKLENYELNHDKKNQDKIKSEDIRKEIVNINKKLNKITKPVDQIVLEQIIKRIEKVGNELAKKNYRYCLILLETVKKLIEFVKK